jgi:hypothetical protein
MSKKLRLFTEMQSQEKIIDLPDDWDSMDEEERSDFCEDEAQDFALSVVKYGSEVVER